MTNRHPNQPNPGDKVRLDKWLWAARFYKTRSLSAEAIEKHRVKVNGQASKPAREVKVGDVLEVQTGYEARTVQVLALSGVRGPAPVATLLYAETHESQALRAATAEQRRLAPEPAHSIAQGRPTKRDRRANDDLRQRGQAGQWDSRWSASIDDD